MLKFRWPQVWALALFVLSYASLTQNVAAQTPTPTPTATPEERFDPAKDAGSPAKNTGTAAKDEKPTAAAK